MLVMEPGSLIMDRKMLLGIKQRAEGLAREQAVAANQHEAGPGGFRALQVRSIRK